MENVNNQKDEPKEPSVALMTKQQLLDAAKNIDANKAAAQIMKWLIKNVENYIDNQESVFLVYFTYDILPEHGLFELKKLQELYYAIPSDKTDSYGNNVSTEDSQEMLKKVDGIVADIKVAMEKDTARLKELFDRLIYYYEMVGFSKVTGPIIKKFSGQVIINHFIYEPISMPVTVTKRMKKLIDGELIEAGVPDEIISQFVVPEGYSIEIELIKRMEN